VVKQDGMTDQMTCGQGLAANAALPAKLGDLTAAMADVLELHTTALDLDDENARLEHAAYLDLTEQHRQAAEALRAISDQMAGYRDLPMASHDLTVLSSAELAGAFEHFVTVEQELLAMLEERIGEDRAMLGQMGRPG